jgi:hypothetical protein
MTDDPLFAYRLKEVERKAGVALERADRLEDRVLLVETKEASRERKANRAVGGVIALGVAIAASVATVLFSGGHP